MQAAVHAGATPLLQNPPRVVQPEFRLPKGAVVATNANEGWARASRAHASNDDIEIDGVAGFIYDAAIVSLYVNPLTTFFMLSGCSPADQGADSEPEMNCDKDDDGYIRMGGGCGGNDCDDHNNSIHPDTSEICDNEKDDNCDGLIDEECSVVPNNPPPPPDTTNNDACIKLEEDKVNEINKNTTICPGEYDADILIRDISNIKLIGNNVIFESGGIKVENATNILVTGFKFLYGGNNAIELINSKDSTISNIYLSEITCGAGIVVDENSTGNTIDNLEVYGPGLGMVITGDNNIIKNSHFEMKEGEYCDIVTGPLIIGDQNTIMDNSFLNHQILVPGGDGNKFYNNEILYPYMGVGILLRSGDAYGDDVPYNSNNNTIEGNIIHYGNIGIKIAYGDNNTVRYNDLRFNDEVGVKVEGGQGNVIYGNQE